jgi:ribonuclease HI
MSHKLIEALFCPRMQPVTVYTDGSCTKGGTGGWAWVVAPDGDVHGMGGVSGTTSQRMEITAAIEAVRSNYTARSIHIVTDSRYVEQTFNAQWYVRWRESGWWGIANVDLWQPFVVLVEQHGRVSFEWVKGHNGNKLNELADEYARRGRARGVR